MKNGERGWTADDERFKTEGLVLILRELHDTLDALVFEAYGWPATLTDEEILERLVALNRQRALEEKAGTIRWLRPDYQVPRFGTEAERARLDEQRRQARADAKAAQIELDEDDEGEDDAPKKPKFPTGNELAETATVMATLASAGAPVTIRGICARFAQGKAVEKRVASTILALARLGHLTSSDNGESFALRAN